MIFFAGCASEAASEGPSFLVMSVDGGSTDGSVSVDGNVLEVDAGDSSTDAVDADAGDTGDADDTGVDSGSLPIDIFGTVDAGNVDAGPGDTGTADAGPVDAGTVDAGPGDTGTADAGIVDAGNADAGPGDTGEADAGTVDAGNADAGPDDTGEADAGPVDAGTADAGPGDTGEADAGPVDAGNADAGPDDTGEADAGPVDAGTADAGPDDTGEADAGPVDTGPTLPPITPGCYGGKKARVTLTPQGVGLTWFAKGYDGASASGVMKAGVKYSPISFAAAETNSGLWVKSNGDYTYTCEPGCDVWYVGKGPPFPPVGSPTKGKVQSGKVFMASSSPTWSFLYVYGGCD